MTQRGGKTVAAPSVEGTARCYERRFDARRDAYRYATFFFSAVSAARFSDSSSLFGSSMSTM